MDRVIHVAKFVDLIRQSPRTTHSVDPNAIKQNLYKNGYAFIEDKFWHNIDSIINKVSKYQFSFALMELKGLP